MSNVEDEACNPHISDSHVLTYARQCLGQGCQAFVFFYPSRQSQREMEPFGCISSPLAVAESLVKSGSMLRKAISDYKDAPAASRHLQRRRLHHLENIAQLDNLPLNVREKLSVPIRSATDIEAAFPDDLGVVKKRDKILWMISGKKKIEEDIRKLQDIEDSSSFTIIAEAIKDLSMLESKILELSTEILLHDQQCASYRMEQQKRHELEVKQLLHALPLSTRHGNRVASRRYTFDDTWLARFLKITVRLAIFQQEEKNTSTTVSIHWTLFFITILMIHIRFDGFKPTIPRLFIRPRYSIPSNSPIIDACKNGNVEKIQALFTAGMARPNDCTSENLTLLRHAIRGQHISVVEMLLNSGADPNATFGAKETSPLNIAFLLRNPDIIRALLKFGGDLEYVNGRAWKTLSYLWDPDPNIASSDTATSEILDICEERQFEGWHHADTIGWAPAHRAAAFGSGSHINKLRSFDVDLQQCTSLTCWTPLHCAARYGNASTLEALSASTHPVILKEMKDRRGWGLLHLAAASGCKKIIIQLISMGFNPDEVTNEATVLIPEELKHKELTPKTIAHHYGHGQAYDEALEEVFGEKTEGTGYIFHGS